MPTLRVVRCVGCRRPVAGIDHLYACLACRCVERRDAAMSVRLSPLRVRIVLRLLQAAGRIVSMRDLLDAVYPNPDVSPDTEIGCVSVAKWHARRAIAPLGIAIHKVRNGNDAGGWRLVIGPIPQRRRNAIPTSGIKLPLANVGLVPYPARRRTTEDAPCPMTPTDTQ